MMPCQECGDRDAVVHLTKIEDNTVTTLHLCEQCAEEKGIEGAPSAPKGPLGDFLSTLGKEVGAGLPGVSDAPYVTCDRCGMSIQEFRDLGRLGCPQCYKSFEGPLRELLRRLHGSTTHVGERYRSPGGPTEDPDEMATELRERLRVAVESENFELAAELRDQLRGVE